jgi:hypothetical protein
MPEVAEGAPGVVREESVESGGEVAVGCVVALAGG